MVYTNTCIYVERLSVLCFVLNFHRRPESLAGKKYRVAIDKAKNISFPKNYNQLLNKKSFKYDF